MYVYELCMFFYTELKERIYIIQVSLFRLVLKYERVNIVRGEAFNTVSKN